MQHHTTPVGQSETIQHSGVSPAAPARTPIFVVLGMHRSGTSAITRGLEALGVSLGGNLIPAIAGDNAKGFFEDVEVNCLNERILGKAGSAWHKLAPLDARALAGAEFSLERREASTLLGQKIGADVFGFKDPRTAVLLPLWQCVFEDLELDDRYVIAVRNPLESALSLEARNNIDLTKGVLLWAKHLAEAMRYTQSRQRVFVSYEQILLDPGLQLTRLARALGLAEPALNNDALKTYEEEFLESSLRRNRVGAKELLRSGRAPKFVMDLYELVRELTQSSENDADLDPSRLQEIVDRYDELAPLLAYADRIEDRSAAAQGELAATMKQVVGANETIDQLRQELDALKTALGVAEQEVSLRTEGSQRLTAELNELRARLASEQERAANERAAAARDLSSLRAAANDESQRLTAELNGLRARLASEAAANDESQRLTAELNGLRARLASEAAANDESQRLSAELNGLRARLASEQERAANERAAAARDLSSLRAAANDESQRLTAELNGLRAHLDGQTRAKDALASQLLDLQRDVEAARARAESAAAEAAQLRRKLDNAGQDLLRAQTALAETRQSTSWRITTPLRVARRILSDPISGTRVTLSAVLRVARQLSAPRFSAPVAPAEAPFHAPNASSTPLADDRADSTPATEIRGHVPPPTVIDQTAREPASGQLATYEVRPNALEALIAEHATFTSAGPEFEEFDPNLLQRPEKHTSAEPLLLAYYLPQFHPIAENDEFWGAGFTEWRQLPRGIPRFPGHYQPRIPRDLGFYDLRNVDVLELQAKLAKAAGIGGFAYYYYWFNGRRVLHQPLDLLLQSDIDMPFVLLWANENWTRTWDGSESEILLRQDYLDRDEDPLLADLNRHFADKRYIRIGDRPLFIIYNPRSIPRARETIARWRSKLAARHGVNPLIFMAQTFGELDPRPYGLDGAIEFPPHKHSNTYPGRPTPDAYSSEFSGRVIKYDEFITASLEEQPPEFPLIKTIVPSWDNDARRPNRGLTLENLSPKKYEAWLRELIQRALKRPTYGKPIVAINAWNEWAESAYLEPDVHFGSAFLNATARAYSSAVADVEVSRRGGRAISVVVPNYNHAQFLEERLHSIIEQNHKPDEIVFLDDASSDNSVEIAGRILARSGIPHRIIVNERNSGSVFRQWVKGIELAQHDLVWIAESDDAADRDFLLKLAPAFEQEGVMAAFGKISYIDENGVKSNDLDHYYAGLRDFSWHVSQTVSAFRAFSWDFTVKNVIPNASGLLFRKPQLNAAELTRLYQYRFAGDWYFYALIARGGAIAYNAEAKSYFRLRRTSASRAALFTERHLDEHRMILCDLQREYGISAEAVKAHARQLETHFPNRSTAEILKAVAPSEVALDERPLRICIAAHSFAVGGGELVPVVLANALKERGHHVTYLVLEKLPPKEKSLRQRLRRDIPVVYWEDVPDPSRFVEHHGFDAFNSHNVSWEWRLACDGVELRTPYVATLHGGYETVAELLERPHFVDYITRNVSAWLYLSDKNVDLLAARHVPLERFKKSFNAIPEFRGPWVDRAAFRAEHGIPEGAFVLVLCSRAIEDKGWKVAMDVVAQASRQAHRQPVHLVLIGDGPYLETAKRLAQDLPNVTLLGHVDNPIKYLRCFDLGILPSTFSGESFPLFLLECFQAGLPVIATAIGEVQNIIGEDGPGVVVPRRGGHEGIAARMTEVVLALLGDRSIYDRMRAKARAVSRRFSAEQLAEDYVSTFRALAHEHSKGQPGTKSAAALPTVRHQA